MHILLAEDDPILADALCAHLRGMGYTVEHAPNGPVAEYLLQRQPFDLSILDLGLPMIDGLPCCATCALPTSRCRSSC